MVGSKFADRETTKIKIDFQKLNLLSTRPLLSLLGPAAELYGFDNIPIHFVETAYTFKHLNFL